MLFLGSTEAIRKKCISPYVILTDEETAVKVANEMQMLDSRGGANANQSAQTPEPQAAAPAPEFDDDIPF